MNKKWECYNNNIEEVQKIAKNFNVSNLLATILSNKKHFFRKRNREIFKSYKK